METRSKTAICKNIAFGVILSAGVVATAFANGSGNEPPVNGDEAKRSSVCTYLPFLCPVGTNGNGSGNEPD